MIKLFILTLLFIALAYGHHPRNFTCTIANTTYNLVQGSINIEFNGTHTIFEVAVTDPSGRLHNTSNGFHIHQFGITNQSGSCADAGKHYNPILNYGEISARAGIIPQSGVVTLVTSWVNWEGDFTVTGRSLVVHDNTTNRLGCCTIESGINDDAEPGWPHSVLKAQFPGLNITFYNDSIGEVNVNYTIDNTVFTDFPANVSIGHAGSCTSVVEYKVGFPQLNRDNLNAALSGVLATNFGEWAGRSVIINGTTGSYCAVLVQAAAQDNNAGNDFYVEPNATTTTTGATSSTTSTTSSTTGATTDTTSSTTGATSTTTSTTSTTTSATSTTTSATSSTTSATGSTNNSMKAAVAIVVGLGILLI